ncbi:hypothetical protein JCGZ_10329 [Jatropha curcas]|uniref:Uncharacterized protein n=1 Tax=Jatropha curcas TaxID=180498 RepID=A0A067KLH9_JATCU|nr:GDSL esterase/lipase At5g03610 [Jatropha curcas]KDP35848.1 hypothetical protein JCGZ_10329 [Jatropha curcas]
MEIKRANALFFFILFSLSTLSIGAQGTTKHNNVKLFIFGDSYVDTGNFKKNDGAWIHPYGFSFPGKPSGRFSDGRVLTDYIASFLGIKTPLAYKFRKYANKTQLERGMNFGHGGSGVFETFNKDFPKFETQIYQLEHLHRQYTKRDFANSVALVCFSGNDYASHMQKNGSVQEMPSLTRRVVDQLVKDIQHIQSLGVAKIAVVGMGPSGCVPQATDKISYNSCNEDLNSASKFHNQMLQQALTDLNKDSKKPTFMYLDLYSSFETAMDALKRSAEIMEYKNPLKPCCSLEINNGERKFIICKHPELAFYWDDVHPSQNGWHSVYLALKPTLKELLIN